MKSSLRSHPLSAAIGAACVLLLSPQVHAGDIVGQLRDADGAPLAGTTVQLRGSDHRAVSDAQGRYRIADVPAGHYQLAAGTLEVGAEVPASGEVRVDLNERSRVLDRVVVMARNRLEASDLEMSADNTVNVLSKEDLQTTAVHNVAEALGLLPGVNVFSPGASYNAGIDGASRGEAASPRSAASTPNTTST